jgi:hypothetical protein
VEAVGDNGIVLGGKDEDEDEDWADAAEVLAFGVLILGAGITVGAAGGAGIAVTLVGGGMSSAVAPVESESRHCIWFAS